MVTPATTETQEIPVHLIDVRPSDFQARETTPGHFFNEDLVRGLVREYDRRKLDPIGVYPNPDSPGRFILTEGHHRFETVRRVGEPTIPGRVLQVDASDPDALRAVKRDAVLSNFRTGRQTLRELVNAAGKLEETGMTASEIAEGMRTHSRGEVERLLDLYRLGPAAVTRINAQPELTVAGQELGRAMRMYPDHYNAENVQALLDGFGRQLEETGKLPGQTTIREQLKHVVTLARSQDVEQAGLLGKDFAGDAVMSAVLGELQSLADIETELRRLRNDRNACSRLATSAGVSVDAILSDVELRIAEVERKREELRNRASGKVPELEDPQPSTWAQQATMGEEFATNQTLGMEMPFYDKGVAPGELVEGAADALPAVAARGEYHQVAMVGPLAEAAEDDTLSRAFEHVPGQSRDDGPGVELMEDLLEEGRDTDDLVEVAITEGGRVTPPEPGKKRGATAKPATNGTDALAVSLAELMRETEERPDDNQLQARYDDEYTAFLREIHRLAPAERKRLTAIAAGKTPPRPKAGPAKPKGKVVFATPMGGRKKRLVRR